jgi:hypothetical protein
MEAKKNSPPGFTSDDTSSKAMLQVPYLYIGLPKIPFVKQERSRAVQIRDLSGNLRSEFITLPQIYRQAKS